MSADDKVRCLILRNTGKKEYFYTTFDKNILTDDNPKRTELEKHLHSLYQTIDKSDICNGFDRLRNRDYTLFVFGCERLQNNDYYRTKLRNNLDFEYTWNGIVGIAKYKKGEFVNYENNDLENTLIYNKSNTLFAIIMFLLVVILPILGCKIIESFIYKQ